jgi:hypothetical protein
MSDTLAQAQAARSPAAPLSRDQLQDALQDAWDEWCADTNAVPGCLVVHGPRTTRIDADFSREPNFLDAVLWRLSAPSSTSS